MDFAHPATLLLPAGIALLVAWRLYLRFKRMVGRQRLSKPRLWLTVGFFPLLVALLLLRSLSHPVSALALAGGLAAGAALGAYGLRRTKFEQTPLGLFYTPNAHLGIALTLLLVVRVGYRAIQLYVLSATVQTNSITFLHSPLTLLIFGMLAGYYVAYAVGLLRWQRRVGSPSMAAEQRGA
jgi:hypothetical protein